MTMSAPSKRTSLVCVIALAMAGVLSVQLVSPLQAVAGGRDVQKPLEDYEETVEQAIDRGLEFLASQQLPNGSFRGQMQGVTAVVSLSIMAFLARGWVLRFCCTCWFRSPSPLIWMISSRILPASILWRFR